MFCLITLIFLGFNSFAQDNKIGVDKKGEYVITANLDYIMKAWNDVLKKQKINTTLHTFEIKSGKDENSGQLYFMLIGYNHDHSTKVACMVNRIGGNFILTPSQSLYTVTCTGCTEGCSPKGTEDGKGWKCDKPCTDCKKTESISY